MSPPERVFVGLGGNLNSRFGGRRETIAAALDRVSETAGVEVVRVSSLYETLPLGPQDQGLFLNAAAELRTGLEPQPLLDRLLAVEDFLGRVRTEHWGPRVIDLDLLFYGSRQMRTETLTLPHPELHLREFVLAPLAEIAPEFVHPVLNRTVADLRREAAGQGARRLEESLTC